MNSNGSFSGSDAAAVKVTAAPAIWGLARSATRSTNSGGLLGTASTTKSIVLELSPSGLWLLSLALTSMVWGPIFSTVVVQVQLGLLMKSVRAWPSTRNMNSNGSFSGSDAAAVNVTAVPAIWGLARSATRSTNSGGLLGTASTTKSIVLELSPSGLWLLSLARASMVWEPISCSVVVQVQLGLLMKSVRAWPSTRNMNSNGSFSGSDAAAVNVTAAPAIWGLARSEARSTTSGGLFGTGSMENWIAWELSPCGLWLLSLVRASMVWEPISCSVVVQVQLGLLMKSVRAWPSTRNMNSNGSFSGSDAAAVNVTAAPAIWGLG
ncbi:hypothetical protein ASZ90_011887 [hydrocarbon metagenome]|uniref:Uncharacterized protein n=1 Tax=hydrocarbon metagenome TaxID=938273 RepID=A0A0W8FC24_9ZZZZ